MGEKTIDTLNFCTNTLIAMYFVILAAERVQSLVRATSKKVLLTDGLHKYMAGLCLFSFAGTIGLLVVKAICAGQNESGKLQLILLCAAVSCILLSGMVHTEYSIPGIQFGAYGTLIIAMILRVISQHDILTPGKRAIVLMYIVAFSMAIPVVYPSLVKCKTAFHITESIVSFVLVALFGVLMYELFAGSYSIILNPVFLITALIGDILVLAMRWQEEINWFVLVSLSAAVVFYIASLIWHRL